MNLWQQEIEAAVVCEWDKAQRNESRAPLLADVLHAIRALPEPEPVSEDELVGMVAKKMRANRRARNEVFAGADADDDDAADVVEIIRSHDRRAADEVRKVLLEVLDAPVVVNDDGATVRDNLEIQRSTRDLRARADRLAKVGP